MKMLQCSLFFFYTCALEAGKFRVKMVSMDRCRGPKQRDCGSVTWAIQDGNLVNSTMYLPKNIGPLMAKIKISTNGKSLVRLQMNKVCENAFMKPFLQSIANITENCGVLKGNYSMTVDIGSVLQKYYGGEFIYGNVSIHSIMFNGECNFSCSIVNAMILPRDKE